MNKTFKISYALKNTYRVNTILFSLKQVPLLKRVLPDTLYRERAFKILAVILSALWDLVSMFAGKLVYFLTMLCGVGIVYDKLPEDQVFLHILLILTFIGSFSNTSLFNPTKDKYYAIFLMRMDAREYTLVDYFYYTIRLIVGFLPFTILFGRGAGLPLWLCLLLPFGIAGMKMVVVALKLWDYEKRGIGYNENKISKYEWGLIGLLLALTYGLPAIKAALPVYVSAAVFLLCIPLGIAGIKKILMFDDYRMVNKELLVDLRTGQMDALTAAKITKEVNEKNISADLSITSTRKGFEYLNELFVKRHRKILWNSTKRIAYVCLALVAGVLILMEVRPEGKEIVNEIVMSWLPYFLFIMYMINRGERFTQALFMNCDHSLLTYSFYKRPDFILRLFMIRLREIIKINALPAVVIGPGLAAVLYVSGGTDQPLNYVVLIVSIFCMSMFFSIHYLTVYYLLQPYNSGTEIKSGTYRIVTWATYFFCFFIMQLRVPILGFGILTILFCIGYTIVAGIAVYRKAPKTFKIRM